MRAGSGNPSSAGIVESSGGVSQNGASARVREGDSTLTSRPSAAWIESDGGVAWLEWVSR